NTPHSSWKPSRLDSSASRITSSSDSTLEPPWQRRFVNAIQFVHVVVNRGSGDAQPRILRHAPDGATFDAILLENRIKLYGVFLIRAENDRRWSFAKKLRRIGGRKSIDMRSQEFVRIEAGFRKSDAEPAFRDVVSRSYQP